MYPNLAIVYKILLMFLVTVASRERSFSELELIKTYLCSKMSQEQLSNIATLLIEKD